MSFLSVLIPTLPSWMFLFSHFTWSPLIKFNLVWYCVGVNTLENFTTCESPLKRCTLYKYSVHEHLTKHWCAENILRLLWCTKDLPNTQRSAVGQLWLQQNDDDVPNYPIVYAFLGRIFFFYKSGVTNLCQSSNFSIYT